MAKKLRRRRALPPFLLSGAAALPEGLPRRRSRRLATQLELRARNQQRYSWRESGWGLSAEWSRAPRMVSDFLSTIGKMDESAMQEYHKSVDHRPPPIARARPLPTRTAGALYLSGARTRAGRPFVACNFDGPIAQRRGPISPARKGSPSYIAGDRCHPPQIPCPTIREKEGPRAYIASAIPTLRTALTYQGPMAGFLEARYATIQFATDGVIRDPQQFII